MSKPANIFAAIIIVFCILVMALLWSILERVEAWDISDDCYRWIEWLERKLCP
jgi:hypothetical protein